MTNFLFQPSNISLKNMIFGKVKKYWNKFPEKFFGFKIEVVTQNNLQNFDTAFYNFKNVSYSSISEKIYFKRYPISPNFSNDDILKTRFPI